MSVVFPCVFFLSRLLCFLYLFPYFVSSLFVIDHLSSSFLLFIFIAAMLVVLVDGEAVATVAECR